MKSKSPTVTCIGELLWDVLPGGRTLGGAPANVAYHVARLGLPVRIVSRIGRDEAGEAARAALQSRGLPIHDLQWDDALPTGAANVTLDASGQAGYSFETPAAWDALAPPDLAPDVVVFGSLAQRDARAQSAVRTVAGRAVLAAYDVNLRPPFTPMEIVTPSLSLAALVKLNEDESMRLAAALGLPSRLREFAGALAARFGIQRVCITRGAAGAVLWADGAWFEVGGLPITPVDTVGAGDAFLAALIRGWLSDENPQRTLECANQLGAYVSTRPGAMPDYEAESVLG
jgi:fructokinase